MVGHTKTVFMGSNSKSTRSINIEPKVSKTISKKSLTPKRNQSNSRYCLRPHNPSYKKIHNNEEDVDFNDDSKNKNEEHHQHIHRNPYPSENKKTEKTHPTQSLADSFYNSALRISSWMNSSNRDENLFESKSKEIQTKNKDAWRNYPKPWLSNVEAEVEPKKSVISQTGPIKPIIIRPGGQRSEKYLSNHSMRKHEPSSFPIRTLGQDGPLSYESAVKAVVGKRESFNLNVMKQEQQRQVKFTLPQSSNFDLDESEREELRPWQDGARNNITVLTKNKGHNPRISYVEIKNYESESDESQPKSSSLSDGEQEEVPSEEEGPKITVQSTSRKNSKDLTSNNLNKIEEKYNEKKQQRVQNVSFSNEVKVYSVSEECKENPRELLESLKKYEAKRNEELQKKSLADLNGNENQLKESTSSEFTPSLCDLNNNNNSNTLPLFHLNKLVPAPSIDFSSSNPNNSVSPPDKNPINNEQSGISTNISQADLNLNLSYQNLVNPFQFFNPFFPNPFYFPLQSDPRSQQLKLFAEISPGQYVPLPNLFNNNLIQSSSLENNSGASSIGINVNSNSNTKEEILTVRSSKSVKIEDLEKREISKEESSKKIHFNDENLNFKQIVTKVEEKTGENTKKEEFRIASKKRGDANQKITSGEKLESGKRTEELTVKIDERPKVSKGCQFSASLVNDKENKNLNEVKDYEGKDEEENNFRTLTAASSSISMPNVNLRRKDTESCNYGQKRDIGPLNKSQNETKKCLPATNSSSSLLSADSSTASIRVLVSKASKNIFSKKSSQLTNMYKEHGSKYCPCFDCRRMHGLRISSSHSCYALSSDLQTNYVRKNIEDLKRLKKQPPPGPVLKVDHPKGDKIPPLINYYGRKGYGKIPDYLYRRKEEIEKDRMRRKEREAQEAELARQQREAEDFQRYHEKLERRREAERLAYARKVWKEKIFKEKIASISETCNNNTQLSDAKYATLSNLTQPKQDYFVYINGKVQSSERYRQDESTNNKKISPLRASSKYLNIPSIKAPPDKNSQKSNSWYSSNSTLQKRPSSPPKKDKDFGNSQSLSYKKPTIPLIIVRAMKSSDSPIKLRSTPLESDLEFNPESVLPSKLVKNESSNSYTELVKAQISNLEKSNFEDSSNIDERLHEEKEDKVEEVTRFNEIRKESILSAPGCIITSQKRNSTYLYPNLKYRLQPILSSHLNHLEDSRTDDNFSRYSRNNASYKIFRNL